MKGVNGMRFLVPLFSLVHAVMAFLFAAAALILMAVAAHMGWQALGSDLERSAAETVIEAIGLLAAAVVALQICQTIVEEEVVRDAHISAPTRVRRFVSRFLVVIVVALAVEALVATFRAHDDAPQLLYVACMLLGLGGLLAAWGLFIHFNREAEELEPEAMKEAKSEDAKLK
ncbi:conserved membrane hypothetical protein [Burkholderiales bacterium 8X]|nr:conserved membrane hypothetical protein [Burkholderiales bacterium 8X]